MKKTLFTVAICLAAVVSFATPPVAENVLKQFTASFPAVMDARWFEGENHYDVYFEKDNAKYVIRYDLNGKVISTRNYYKAEKLAPFLRAKLAEKFPNKSIYGVTEITNNDEMYCVVNLEDAKTWTTVKINAIGQMNVMERMQKSSN